MRFTKFNLQFFAEGGGESGSSTGLGEIGGTEDVAVKRVANSKGRNLDNVVYGKVSSEDMPSPSEEDTKTSNETKSKAFEDLIKGEYKEEFNKRTQGIINERFKNTKGLEEKLKSHDPLMKMLGDKYGVDYSDVAALTKALEDDESFYQDEALEKGLTVKQLKEIKALERENNEFKRAREEADRIERTNAIYSDWMKQGDEFAKEYGLKGFSLEAECENPEFSKMLQLGVGVKSAYMAIHMDDMLGGAMAHTADTVKKQITQNIQNRNSRPSENGVSSQNSMIFKTDVNKLTRADRDEIERRALRGEIISF